MGSGFEQAREVWSRRHWLWIAVFVVVFTAVTSVATYLPNLYRSTATVLVERHQVPETFVRSLVTGELETRLQTISQEILSRARLQDLIARFDLYQDLRQRVALEDVVGKMRRDIQFELKGVEAMGGRGATIAFNLSYRGREPETVAQVTNALAAYYVEENVRRRAQQVTSTADFLKAQLDDVKVRLDQQDRRVKEFRTRHVGELPQQMSVNLATLERLHAQLHLNGANQLRAMDRRTALERQLTEADLQGTTSAPSTAAVRLSKLRQELRELRGFTDRYPDVVQLKAEIAALENELAQQRQSARQPASLETIAPPMPAAADPAVARVQTALRQAEAEIRALQNEEQDLRRDIAAYQRRVESVPQREQELQDLSRDYEATKELYQSLLKRYEDARLAESMEQHQRGEQFRILDPAIPAKLPAAPNRMALFVMGLLLSVALATGAVVVAEYVDTSFHNVDRLRSITDVPVLVSIPLIATDADRRRIARRLWLTAVSGVVGLAFIVMASHYVATGNEQLVRMMMRGGS